MAWYNTGTIALTNGSATVTGSGTNFLVGAQIGEALYAPDGKLYEIQTINSATVITLASNYLGSTATGQSYQIIPTQSLVADLASDVTDLISDFANVRDYAGNGKFNDGAVGTPGITFTQDQDNGLYRIGSNNWALAAGGQQVVNLTTTAMNFPDNSKAIFGAGSDLQIYHDGGNSYIKDVGAGDLRIWADSPNISTASGNKIFYGNNGSAELYTSGGTLRLATTASGIDVTGTVTADGATIEGALELNSNSFKHTALTPSHTFIESDVTGENTQFLQASGTLRIRTVDDSVLNPVERLRIDHGTGDISFYSSDGLSQALFWDASASALGLGTTTPASPIEVRKAIPDITLSSEAQTWAGGEDLGGVNWFTYDTSGIGAHAIGSIKLEQTGTSTTPATAIVLSTSLTNALPVERMRIDPSGHAIIPAGVTLGTAAGVYNAANTLDDYEEGTWTPAFANMGTGTYTTQYGTYTKVGNLVTASVHIDINVLGTASGSLDITPLPFTSSAASIYNYGNASAIHAQNFTAAAEGLNVLIFPNTATASIYSGAGTTAGAVALTHAVMGTGNFLCTLVYFTA